MNDRSIQQLLGGRPFEPSGDGSILCCNSRGYVTTLTCSRCSKPIDFVIWTIVDGDRRPDLLQQIGSGTLHKPTCPSCSHVNHIESDLLLIRPSRKRVLIFAPAKDNTSDETRKVVRSFLLKLKGQMGRHWKDEWYEKDGRRGIYIVKRFLLRILLRMKLI